MRAAEAIITDHKEHHLSEIATALASACSSLVLTIWTRHIGYAGCWHVCILIRDRRWRRW